MIFELLYILLARQYYYTRWHKNHVPPYTTIYWCQFCQSWNAILTGTTLYYTHYKYYTKVTCTSSFLLLPSAVIHCDKLFQE